MYLKQQKTLGEKQWNKQISVIDINLSWMFWTNACSSQKNVIQAVNAKDQS